MTDKPSIDTLVKDVHELFGEKDIKPSEENFHEFLEEVGSSVLKALAPGSSSNEVSGRDGLRMSNIGTPDRRLWFACNRESPAPDPGLQKIFLTGHILEAFFLMLFKEAGHVVEREQEEIEIDGIKGHIDAVIDGVLVDIKTTSPHNYNKIASGKLFEDDPYGYVAQLCAYNEVVKAPRMGWIIIDKISYKFEFVELLQTDKINAPKRINHVKKMVDEKEPPMPYCYEPEEDGSSGNKVLNKNCNWCPFKEECWKDANDGKGLRKFKYKKKDGYFLKYFTEVKKKPRVEEVKNS